MVSLTLEGLLLSKQADHQKTGLQTALMCVLSEVLLGLLAPFESQAALRHRAVLQL